MPTEPLEGHDQNADQIAYWNGPGGQRWADRQHSQDVMLAPVSDLLIDRARPQAGRADHRCRLRRRRHDLCLRRKNRARRPCARHRHFGADAGPGAWHRSWPRSNAQGEGMAVDFELADATVYPFEPASFDLLASRFGVMFFAQPALSFANMRKALKPSGRLAFACWRSRAKIRFSWRRCRRSTNTCRDCRRRDPKTPVRSPSPRRSASTACCARPDFPGLPWSRVISRSTWRSGSGLDAAVQSALEIGPASRALAEQPDDVRAAARQFDPRGAGGLS